MKKQYTLTINGHITIETENFDEINLSQYKITDLQNLTIQNVKKEEITCIGKEQS